LIEKKLSLCETRVLTFDDNDNIPVFRNLVAQQGISFCFTIFLSGQGLDLKLHLISELELSGFRLRFDLFGLSCPGLELRCICFSQ